MTVTELDQDWAARVVSETRTTLSHEENWILDHIERGIV